MWHQSYTAICSNMNIGLLKWNNELHEAMLNNVAAMLNSKSSMLKTELQCHITNNATNFVTWMLKTNVEFCREYNAIVWQDGVRNFAGNTQGLILNTWVFAPSPAPFFNLRTPTLLCEKFVFLTSVYMLDCNCLSMLSPGWGMSFSICPGGWS